MVNPVVVGNANIHALQVIAENKKQVWLRYDATLGKWSEMGPWTKEKQRVWEKFACTKLKIKELAYKDARNIFEDAKEGR